MKNKVTAADIDPEMVVECFDTPDAMAGLLRMLDNIFPDNEPETIEEIAALLKCVYISGVFCGFKAINGHTSKEIEQHLRETWDRIYWMQHNHGEA